MFDSRERSYYNDKTNKSFLIADSGWNCQEGDDCMKSTGIIRKVDDLGRIVLPIELRRMLDIEERDELEIYMENERIILQKYEPSCIFCGSSRDLVSYRGRNLCQDCIRQMTAKP